MKDTTMNIQLFSSKDIKHIIKSEIYFSILSLFNLEELGCHTETVLFFKYVLFMSKNS